jgi:hypothetical protein
MNTPSPVSRAPAWVTLGLVAVITGACFNMALVLRDGLAIGTPFVTRALFLTHRTGLWQLGWLNWMASALGLLLFCVYLLDYLPPTALRRFAILLVAIGVGPDISAEVVFAFVLPPLLQIDQPATLFMTLEQIAMQLTGTVGNGLYNLGGLLLNLLLFVNPCIPRLLIVAGLPAWLFGLALSVATALHAVLAATLLTGVAMALSLCWMLAVALILFTRPDKYRWSAARV